MPKSNSLVFTSSIQVILAGKLTEEQMTLMQSFGGPFYSKIT